jgi:hypothetical protein
MPSLDAANSILEHPTAVTVQSHTRRSHPADSWLIVGGTLAIHADTGTARAFTAGRTTTHIWSVSGTPRLGYGWMSTKTFVGSKGATPMPRPSHHAEVIRQTDGRFVVRCVTCDAGDRLSIPVGIGIPLESREVAEFVRHNHGAGTTLKIAGSGRRVV